MTILAYDADIVDYMNRLDDARQLLVDAVSEPAMVLALAAVPSTHRLAVAARMALEIRLAREDRARPEKEAADAISAAVDWVHVANNHVPFEEIQRRRAVPGPMSRSTD